MYMYIYKTNSPPSPKQRADSLGKLHASLVELVYVVKLSETAGPLFGGGGGGLFVYRHYIFSLLRFFYLISFLSFLIDFL